MARSTERPYRSRPWAQQRGADGAQVRDGTDDFARVQGAETRCTRPQIHGGEGDAGRGSARLMGVSRGGSDPKRQRLSTCLQSGQCVSGRDERPYPRVAGPLCSLVCLRIPRQGEAYRDRGSPGQTASLDAAVLRGDRPTCENLTAGWLQKETS